jgi:hypothetical protein
MKNVNKIRRSRDFRFRTMFVSGRADQRRAPLQNSATHSCRESNLLIGFAPVGQETL